MLFFSICGFSQNGAAGGKKHKTEYVFNNQNWHFDNCDTRYVVYVNKSQLPFRVEFPIRSTKYIDENQYNIIILSRQNGRQITKKYLRELNSDDMSLAFLPPEEGFFEIYLRKKTNLSPSDQADLLYFKDYVKYISLPKAENIAVEFRYEKLSDEKFAKAATNTESDNYFSKKPEKLKIKIIPDHISLYKDARVPLSFIEKNKNDKNFIDTIVYHQGHKSLLKFALVSGIDNLKIEKISFVDFCSKKYKISSDKFDVISNFDNVIKSGNIGQYSTILNFSKDVPYDIYKGQLLIKTNKGDFFKDICIDVRTNSEDNLPSENFPFFGFDTQLSTDKTYNIQNKITNSVSKQSDTFSFSDNSISISSKTGLPSSISVKHSQNIVASPFMLVLTTEFGVRKVFFDNVKLTSKNNKLSITAQAASYDIILDLNAELVSNSELIYSIKIAALSEVKFKDVSLEMSFNRNLFDSFFSAGNIKIDKDTSIKYSETKIKDLFMQIKGKPSFFAISIPEKENNYLYTSDNTSIDFYKSDKIYVKISSGEFTANKNTKKQFDYKFKFLPEHKNVNQNKFRTFWVDDFLPDTEYLKGIDKIILKSPNIILNDKQAVENLKLLSAKGVRIEILYNGYIVEENSPYKEVLELLGYEFNFNKALRIWEIKNTPEFRNRQIYFGLFTKFLSKDFINGAVIYDDPVSISNAETLFNIGSKLKNDFSLSVIEKTTEDNIDIVNISPILIEIYYLDKKRKHLSEHKSGLYYQVPFENDFNIWQSLTYSITPYMKKTGFATEEKIRQIWDLTDNLQIYRAQKKLFSHKGVQMPIFSDNPNISIAMYYIYNKILVVAYNESSKEQNFYFHIDSQKLGLNKIDVFRIETPKIEGVQKQSFIYTDKKYSLEPKKGVLFFLENKHSL